MPAARGTQTLTFTGQPLNTETVTIGSKVYTFLTVLTNVDGNVKIGATAAESIANLQAAINLGAGAGSVYAAAMTLHPSVKATAITATTLVVSSKIGGVHANLLATTKTLTNASWGAATLAGGSGDPSADFLTLLSSDQINAAAAHKINALVNP
jgi:hypothetical protein